MSRSSGSSYLSTQCVEHRNFSNRDGSLIAIWRSVLIAWFAVLAMNCARDSRAHPALTEAAQAWTTYSLLLDNREPLPTETPQLCENDFSLNGCNRIVVAGWYHPSRDRSEAHVERQQGLQRLFRRRHPQGEALLRWNARAGGFRGAGLVDAAPRGRRDGAHLPEAEPRSRNLHRPQLPRGRY